MAFLGNCLIVFQGRQHFVLLYVQVLLVCSVVTFDFLDVSFTVCCNNQDHANCNHRTIHAAV